MGLPRWQVDNGCGLGPDGEASGRGLAGSDGDESSPPLTVDAGSGSSGTGRRLPTSSVPPITRITTVASAPMIMPMRDRCGDAEDPLGGGSRGSSVVVADQVVPSQ